MRRIRILAASVCVIASITAPALAQTSAAPSASVSPAVAAAAPAEAAAPAKIYPVPPGLDFTAAYLSQGILQNSGGAIGQPYAVVASSLKRGITGDFGTWKSIPSPADLGNWYERDYFGS